MKEKPYDLELMTGQPQSTSRGLRSKTCIVEEAVVEPVEEQAVEETHKQESKVGTVHNCTKVNLRRTPVYEINGKNIVAELVLGTAVVIDDEKSTDEFYKVTTEDGLEGYCMKQFIRLAE